MNTHVQILVRLLVYSSLGARYKRDLLRTNPNLKSNDCQFSKPLSEVIGLVPLVFTGGRLLYGHHWMASGDHRYSSSCKCRCSLPVNSFSYSLPLPFFYPFFSPLLFEQRTIQPLLSLLVEVWQHVCQLPRKGSWQCLGHRLWALATLALSSFRKMHNNCPLEG